MQQQRIELRRRHRPPVHLAPRSCSGIVGMLVGVLVAAAARLVAGQLRHPVPDLRAPAPAAHQRGDLRVRRQHDLRRRLLLDAAPAQGAHGVRPAVAASTSGAGRRSSSPPRSRCRSASRTARSTPSSSGRSTSPSRSSGSSFAINFFWTLAQAATRSTSTSRSGSTSRRSSRSRCCTSSTTSRSRSAPLKSYSIYARRAGRARAVVVRAQRRRVLPDHAVPRHHVLLPAQGGGAAGLLVPALDPPLLVAGLHLHLGRARTTCSTPRCPSGRRRSAWSSASCCGRRRGAACSTACSRCAAPGTRCAEDPVLKFFVVGVTFYGMATFEGPLLSIKSRQRARALHRLDHRPRPRAARSAGTASWRSGMFYWLVPRLYGTQAALARRPPTSTSGSGRSASCSTSSRCGSQRHHAGPDVARATNPDGTRSTRTSSRRCSPSGRCTWCASLGGGDVPGRASS